MSKQCVTAAFALALLWSAPAFAQDSAGGREGGWHHGWENSAEWHQKWCTERYARKMARLAYLEAKLSLNEQQRAAWTRWRQTKHDAAEQRRSACLQHKPGEAKPNALEREARMEKSLSARLAQLQASKPALQALYDSLSTEQKAMFDEAQSRHRHRWHHRRPDGDEQREGRQRQGHDRL